MFLKTLYPGSSTTLLEYGGVQIAELKDPCLHAGRLDGASPAFWGRFSSFIHSGSHSGVRSSSSWVQQWCAEDRRWAPDVPGGRAAGCGALGVTMPPPRSTRQGIFWAASVT